MIDVGYIFMLQSGTVTAICNCVALEFFIRITFHRQPNEVLPPVVLRRFGGVRVQSACVLPRVVTGSLVRLVVHFHILVCRRVVLPFDDTPYDRISPCIILPQGTCLHRLTQAYWLALISGLFRHLLRENELIK